MILDRCSLAGLLMALAVAGRPAGAYGNQGFDPASPLESRVKDPTEAALDVANHFRQVEVSPRVARDPARPQTAAQVAAVRRRRRDQGPTLRGPDPAAHRIIDAERAQLKAAVAALPPGFRRVLMRRLRAFNFVDHMVVGGTVVVVNPGEPESLHDIAINANVFGRTASAWLTAKEQGVFVPGDSAIGVRFEVVGDLDALTYVLLHEAAHLVDGVEGITWVPPYPPDPRARFQTPARQIAPRFNPFLAGVWGENYTPEPRYNDPRRAAIGFYAAAGAISADEIPAVYASLAATPFVSLYAARNPPEDFAEFAAVAHLTEAMGRRYRVVLHIEGIEVLAYEPMRSDLVRSRLGAFRRFADEAESPVAGESGGRAEPRGAEAPPG